MSMSKISRSIVVVIFVALIIFLGVTDCIYISRGLGDGNGPSNLVKLGYAVLVFALVFLYTYVREKISRLKLQKAISTMYRYIYIILVMLGSTFFKIYNVMDLYPKPTLILYFVLTYFIGFLIQRIIFNVSKSDVLSVLGMFISFTFPNIIDDKTMDLNSKFISFTLLLSIYVMQRLIDELKQLNIKNKKYMIQAAILGVCIGISTLVGNSYLIWIVLGVMSLFITSNLDTTNLKLSNKPNNAIRRKKNNYFIYKVERIKISKLLISLIIISVIVVCIYFGGRILVTKLAINQNGVCTNIVNDLRVGVNTSMDTSLTNATNQAYSFAEMSTKFYLLCYIYIIIMEVLSVILHRKYDTKSTLLKIIFIALFAVLTIYKVNIFYYQPILTLLLVIICIVNTTNIYYNREERIKMIEA